jgi:hypothetical protein
MPAVRRIPAARREIPYCQRGSRARSEAGFIHCRIRLLGISGLAQPSTVITDRPGPRPAVPTDTPGLQVFIDAAG